jgi:predicted ferric reductase
MSEYTKRNYLIPATLILIGLPLLFWALGDFPQRTVLKESLSVLSVLAFCLMLGQFFLARSNKSALKSLKMSTALKFHKVIGYIFVVVLLVHPFLIVVPRYFESGVEPMEAFITIITTFDSLGVVLGIIAWCLMFILGVTALIRNMLPMKYKTWRVFHGVLAILFISLATWHAVDLGRHTDQTMSIYMIILAASGVLLLLKTYIFKSSRKNGGQIND